MVPEKKVITLMHAPEIEIKQTDIKNKEDIIMVAGCYNHDNIYSIRTPIIIKSIAVPVYVSSIIIICDIIFCARNGI